MTHDELLAKMSKPAHNLNANDARNVYLLALRVVVELHKPIVLNEGYVETGEEPRLTCECDPWNEYEHGYPCPTIQTIQEQLK